MAPRWATLSRPLILVLLGVNVIITLVFSADVESQSGAYATGVLVLILSAAFAATLSLWREQRYPLALYSGLLTLLRYWEWTPEEDVRPLIFLMSD
jgi:hypothetical protein